MRNYYLIDYENVGSEGLAGVSNLSSEDEVVIFYSTNSNRLTMRAHIQILASAAKFEYFEVAVGGKDALDHQISTFIGFLVGMKEGEKYYIVSRDTGYRYVANFWNTRLEQAPVLCIDAIKSAQRRTEAMKAQAAKAPAKAPAKAADSAAAPDTAEDAVSEAVEAIPAAVEPPAPQPVAPKAQSIPAATAPADQPAKPDAVPAAAAQVPAAPAAPAPIQTAPAPAPKAAAEPQAPVSVLEAQPAVSAEEPQAPAAPEAAAPAPLPQTAPEGPHTAMSSKRAPKVEPTHIDGRRFEMPKPEDLPPEEPVHVAGAPKDPVSAEKSVLSSRSRREAGPQRIRRVAQKPTPEPSATAPASSDAEPAQAPGETIAETVEPITVEAAPAEPAAEVAPVEAIQAPEAPAAQETPAEAVSEPSKSTGTSRNNHSRSNRPHSRGRKPAAEQPKAESAPAPAAVIPAVSEPPAPQAQEPAPAVSETEAALPATPEVKPLADAARQKVLDLLLPYEKLSAARVIEMIEAGKKQLLCNSLRRQLGQEQGLALYHEVKKAAWK